ncbi:MAG: CRTAC1 family protein [Myxococcales bacterium]|nr:CRTAC1 family protein [Myxococcales bacterium]
MKPIAPSHRVVKLVALAAVAALGGVRSAAAAPQTVDFQHDDGTFASSLNPAGKPPIVGAMIAAGFWVDHAFQLDAVELGFVGPMAKAKLHVWRDNGGGQPGVPEGLMPDDAAADRIEPRTVTSPGQGQWLQVDLKDEAVVVQPWTRFWVGIEVLTVGVNLATDTTKAGADSGDPHAYLFTPKADPCLGGCILAGWNLLVRAHGRYLDPKTGPRGFTDVTKVAGVEHAGRIAWGDYDGDGDEDLLMGGARLWRNDGAGKFDEVTKAAGLEGLGGGGGLWGDADNDGKLDIFVFGGTERLIRNRGDGTFEVAVGTDWKEAADRDWPTESAIWLDIDQDGWLDLYTANYETVKKDAVSGEDVLGLCDPDILWLNNKNGTFARRQDVIDKALPGQNKQCGRGLAAADWDLDGDVDLFVNNYRLKPNLFLRNDGGLVLTNIAKKNGTIGSGIQGAYGHGTGTQWVDADMDGDYDLFVANLAHPRYIKFSDRSRFFQNLGKDKDFQLSEHREASGIGYLETHSEARFADVDNDGDLDLAIGAYYGDRAGQLWRNDGVVADPAAWLAFSDWTYESGWLVKGCATIAWADMDGDGDLDQMANALFRNDFAKISGKPGHWLQVRLHGAKAVNRAAIGAWAEVTLADGRTVMRQIEGGHGIGSQDSLVLHFGLGAQTSVPKLTVHWPGLPAESAGPFAADQVVEWTEGAAAQGWKPGQGPFAPDVGPAASDAGARADTASGADAAATELATDTKPAAAPKPAPAADDGGCRAVPSAGGSAWFGGWGLLSVLVLVARRRSVKLVV